MEIFYFFSSSGSTHSENLKRILGTLEGRWLHKIFPNSLKFLRLFNSPLAFCGLLSHVKKIFSLFYLLTIFLVSFRFCCVSLRFVSLHFISACFVSFLFHFLFYNHTTEGGMHGKK